MSARIRNESFILPNVPALGAEANHEAHHRGHDQRLSYRHHFELSSAHLHSSLALHGQRFDSALVEYCDVEAFAAVDESEFGEEIALWGIVELVAEVKA